MNTLLELPPTSTDPLEGVFRLSVQQYLDMGKHGILTPEHRVELIDGIIRKKPMQNPPHATVIRRLTSILCRNCPEDWLIQSQLPIQLEDGCPEPDFSIIRAPDEQYHHRLPIASEVGLLIEVANTSINQDSTRKLGLYASAAIPIYWIINIPARQVEVYTEPLPAEDRYAVQTIYTPGQEVPVVLDGQTIASLAVAVLFPPGEGA